MLDTPDEGRLLDKGEMVRSNKEAVPAVASSKQQLQQVTSSSCSKRLLVRQMGGMPSPRLTLPCVKSCKKLELKLPDYVQITKHSVQNDVIISTTQPFGKTKFVCNQSHNLPQLPRRLYIRTVHKKTVLQKYNHVKMFQDQLHLACLAQFVDL